MAHGPAVTIEAMVKAHAASSERDIARLRTLSLHERGVLIELACEAAATMARSRAACRETRPLAAIHLGIP
jgi:hypothetical protein